MPPEQSEVVNIIFDTDMGSDCDDAGALALLHKYADINKVNILGVIYSSGKNRHGIGVCDAINTYYCRSDIPIGQYAGNDVGDPNDNYSTHIAMDTIRFPHKIIDSSEDMMIVYKRILSSQPDHSVTIVTVGHPHALYFLINDQEGLNLIQTKVQKVVSMAGDWNFCQVGAIQYTSDILEKLPVDMYFSESGTEILTGHKLLPKTPDNNPVREAYRLYGSSLTNGRPSWDQIAVLFAIKPQLFQVDSIGSYVMNSENEVYWNAKINNPKHKYIRPETSNTELENLIEEMMAKSPLLK
jgi:inosine-uridine nucleoside N-ribohydrolase